jgi:toxin ParE1/3/4
VKPYKLHPKARSDILQASEYYERESWLVAGRFVAEMNRLVDEVCASPGVYRPFWRQARRHFGGKFPYAVIYTDEPEHVVILAFAHFKRRPGY